VTLKLERPSGHDDSVFVVSVSGGKDSTATLLALIEADIPCRAVFADTMWEASETYEHLEVIERELGITIARVGVPGGMLEIARKKAGFPHRSGRWCTTKLKVEPLRAYHNALIAAEDCETVSVVGIRAEESDDRAKMPVFEFDDRWGGYVWRPITRWTIAEVIEIHHRFGIPMNPLYLRGHERVGCYPCINESKASVALIAKHSPARIVEVDGYEREFSAERVRRNASGEGNFAHTHATFFMSKIPGEMMGIHEVVAWSRTSRGGRQLPLIQESPDSGCFRWGMCEPPTKGDEE
jgi:3'-phosphoadenosine 5'-phosphosulfate sulfotransferase (PAPS reductase)/FAD synthetase